MLLLDCQQQLLNSSGYPGSCTGGSGCGVGGGGGMQWGKAERAGRRRRVQAHHYSFFNCLLNKS